MRRALPVLLVALRLFGSASLPWPLPQSLGAGLNSILISPDFTFLDKSTIQTKTIQEATERYVDLIFQHHVSCLRKEVNHFSF